MQWQGGPATPDGHNLGLDRADTDTGQYPHPPMQSRHCVQLMQLLPAYLNSISNNGRGRVGDCELQKLFN